MSSITTVSAPGKVLLAGGYLVLEAPNEGLVIAADKRFYCTVEKIQAATTVDQVPVRVRSPQFHAFWEYTFALNNGSARVYPTLTEEPTNSFVEKTLRVTLAYLGITQPRFFESIQSLDITICADNDFYSVLPHLKERKWEAKFSRVSALPKFLPCPVDRDGKAVVHKTGLGSSAALVTSLVGALLQTFLVESKSNLWEEQTYRLAQICHCHAQGKVGSGFDVSAAVHGSHVYRRFPKRLLSDLLQDLDGSGKPKSAIAQNEISLRVALHIQKLVDDTEWTGGVVSPLKLPEGLQLMLADVGGGSESPSMARRVLQWKQQCEEKEGETPASWRKLAELNCDIVRVLKCVPSLGESLISALAITSLDQATANVPEELLELRRCFSDVRTTLKTMGKAVDVPIEPDAQTDLANATMDLPGVVAALVPGAGGFDAMACLHVDSPSVQELVGSLWSGWKTAPVCPLAVQGAGYGDGIAIEHNFELRFTENGVL